MSGIAHAIGKVFHGIVNIWHKVWKPLVIAAAIYFTGGAALGMMGAASAGGGLLTGAGAGISAAAGGIGIGSGAGIGGAFAAGAGTAAAAGGGAAAVAGAGLTVDAGAAGLTDTAATDAAIGVGADATAGSTVAAGADAAAAGGLDSALASSGVDAVAGDTVGGSLPSLVADASAQAGASIGSQPLMGVGDVTGGMQAAPVDSAAAEAGMAPTSMWGGALHAAGQIMRFPGVTQGLFGMLQSYGQGQMYNQELKWREAHAPGQITGGVKNAFAGFAMNPNLQQTPIPQAAHMTMMAGGPNPMAHGNPAPNAPGVFGQTTNYRAPYTPGMNDPYAASAHIPGYGLPGFGVQSMPLATNNPEYQQIAQAGLLGPQPFMDDPNEQTQPYYG
jgi:hypothetical protein